VYRAAYVFVGKGCLLICVITFYFKNFISVSEIDFCVTDICENIATSLNRLFLREIYTLK
jgi:hypothetical protein